MVVYMKAMCLSVAWGVFDIWTCRKEGNVMKVYIDFSTLMPMKLTFSLLVKREVIS